MSAEDRVPRRIQRQRTKGWRMPDNTVYVGRPTKWGNPFTVAGALNYDFANSVVEARKICVENFRGLADAICPASHYLSRESVARELQGKNLACWCPLDQPCHADVLLEWANPALGTRHSELGTGER